MLFRTGTQRFAASVKDGAETWTLTASGDLAPIGGALSLIEESRTEDLCRQVKNLVNADISITNLETGLYSEKPDRTGAVTASLDAFMQLHQVMPFTIYGMANNHIRDAGCNELSKTIHVFEQTGIKFTGVGKNRKQADSPLFIDIADTKLGILAYTQNEGQIATETEPGAALLSRQNIMHNIPHLIKESDVSIVILHEGFEFMPVPRKPFRKLCRDIADAGVKLIIGHHPHVPQGIEQYGDSLIFYSLGNFMFDLDYHRKYKWASRSFIPKITFSGDTITELTIQPIRMQLHPFSIQPASKEDTTYILSHLDHISSCLHLEECTYKYIENFFTNVLLPEFFNFIRRTGNNTDGNYAEMIQSIKSSEPTHKLFSDFLGLYGYDIM